MRRVGSLTAFVLCCALVAGCGGREVTNIERVLKEDATTGTGATTVAQVVNRMKAIDTSGCPNDFKAAYLAHVHAWEMMAEVEKEAIALKANSEGAGVLVESFIRGFLGDPLGKASEISAAQNQLQQKYQTASDQVKQTFHRVQELAVAHGAKINKKK